MKMPSMTLLNAADITLKLSREGIVEVTSSEAHRRAEKQREAISKAETFLPIVARCFRISAPVPELCLRAFREDRADHPLDDAMISMMEMACEAWRPGKADSDIQDQAIDMIGALWMERRHVVCEKMEAAASRRLEEAREADAELDAC